MSELQPGLEKRLAHVKQMLSEAEEKAGRPQGCVKLLAVGKTFNQEALLECARAGALAFGENYAQEGCTKIDWFRTNHPELHLELPSASIGCRRWIVCALLNVCPHSARIICRPSTF